MSDIRLSCPSCEARLKLSGVTGKSVKCPRCGKAIRVPEPGTEGEDNAEDTEEPPTKKRPGEGRVKSEKSPRKAGRSRDEEDDSDEEVEDEEERSRGRGKGRREKAKAGVPVLLWAGLGGGGLVLAGGVILAVVLLRPGPGKRDGGVDRLDGGKDGGGAGKLPSPPALAKRSSLDTGLPARVSIDANRVMQTETGWLAISADGKTAAVSRTKGPNNVRVFDVANARQLSAFSRGGELAPRVALSPDGAVLALRGDFRTTLALYDARRGQLVRELKAERKGGGEGFREAESFAFSPKGDAVYAASGSGDIAGWDARSGDQLFYWDKALQGGILYLRITPEGGKLAAQGSDLRTVAVWDIKSGDKVQTITTGPGDMLEATSVSADGSTIGAVRAGSDSGKAFLWDLPSGRPLLTARARTGNSTSDSFFLKDPKTLYFFDRTGTEHSVHYWNVDAGDRQGQWADPAFKGVKAVATTPDRTILAVYNAEGVLTIYDVRN